MDPEATQYQDNHKLEQAVLITLLKTAAGGSSHELSGLRDNAFDWPWFISTSRLHGLSPLVYYLLNRENKLREHIPSGIREALENELWQARRQEVITRSAGQEVLKKLQESGLRPVVLKGAASARFYPEDYLRLFSDLDVMVGEEEIAAVKAALASLDYQAISFDNNTGITEIPTASGRNEAEAFGIHWHSFARIDETTRTLIPGFLPVEVHDPLHRGVGCHCLIHAGGWLARSQPEEIYGIPAWILSPEDNLIYLASHLRADHIFRSTRGLRQIFDLYLLVRKGIDWATFLESFRRFAVAQEKIIAWFNEELKRQRYSAAEGPWFDGCDIVTNVHYGLRCVEEIFGPIIPVPVLAATRPEENSLLDLALFPPDNLFLWKIPMADRIIKYSIASPRELVEKKLVRYWRKAPPFTIWQRNSQTRKVWERAPRIKP